MISNQDIPTGPNYLTEDNLLALRKEAYREAEKQTSDEEEAPQAGWDAFVAMGDGADVKGQVPEPVIDTGRVVVKAAIAGQQ